MKREQFLTILRELNTVCKQVNMEQRQSNPDNKVVYEVLQYSDLALKWCSVYDIANFYNQNWLGNADFMHIPDLKQTLQNCRKYPIIIAREEGTDTLLGISTIKYDENTKDHVDPYFPETDAKYFSITGILSKRDNPYKGIGKKIYEIALRGAHGYEAYYPGTRIMCVIDCRNNHSLRALSSAVENIQENSVLGENVELPANILGYYELRDKENDKLLEAPTLVMEVGLQGREKTQKSETRTIEYQKNQNESLFESLLQTLKGRLNKYRLSVPIINEDKDCGMVSFYSLQDRERCRLQGINILSNGTEKGNNRIPRDDKEIYGFVGPMPKISIEGEAR